MTELDLIGQQARSREGRGFAVKGGVGDSDKWITIQQNTFTNWVNLQLQGTELHVEDLHTDLCDGVKLCVLVESLQKKRVGRVIKKPMNQHQFLENVSLALNAIAQDNVKLVNIGKFSARAGCVLQRGVKQRRHTQTGNSSARTLHTILIGGIVP